jgi:hypothetical protein
VPLTDFPERASARNIRKARHIEALIKIFAHQKYSQFDLVRRLQSNSGLCFDFKDPGVNFVLTTGGAVGLGEEPDTGFAAAKDVSVLVLVSRPHIS